MSLPAPLRRRPPTAQTAALVERITREADLRHALVAGDLVLRYHPIVDVTTGRAMAFEALCRWRHWSSGLLAPAEFLPLAEETGLIVPIGGWVLEESCRRLAQWAARLDAARSVDVTVNLSPAELRDRGLVDRAARALEAAGLPAERLVVEVNEPAAYADPAESAARNVAALAELGVGLAIDDVGAPYPGNRSGVPDPDGWLWSGPVRLVKLDRGVGARLGAGGAGGPNRGHAAPNRGLSGRAARILSAALGLAARRDAAVVVKGIETAEQLAQVYALGCPAGQGFLFARPMDAADAEVYLRRVLPSPRSA